MKKFLSFLLFALCLTVAANAQPQTLTVGDPPTYFNSVFPINGFWLDSEGTLSQFIIPAESLADMDGGTISKMIFYTLASYYIENDDTYSPDSNPSDWLQESGAVFSVALSEVSATEFVSGDNPSGYDHSSLTEVYHGTFPESIDQLEIEFDNPYPYHGGNLLVSIIVEEGGDWGTCYWIGVSDEETNLSYYQYYDDEYFGTSTFLPKTTFEYVPAPCVISEIEITGFTEPVYGETPDYDVEVPADANYTLGNVYWSENSIVMNTPVPFGANEYFMNIYIIPNEGCTFSDEVSVTINGNTEPVDPFSEVISDGSYHIYTIDYTLSAPSTCETPTNLTATNITATSAKLGWTGNLEQYTVRYKDDAASDWTTATTANSTLALTGLTPATTYTAQVQGDCGSGAKSVTDWSEPVTFTTLSGTVEPGECGPAEDCDGISYPTVKIGDVCWMTKNLAAETCVTTGNVYSYVNDQFPDEDANVETYGLLYDEEAAFATGICPEGYTLPTTEQFEYLKNNFTVEELRNGTGWIVNTGTNGTGFSWDGSGFRNGTSETFEHMLMEGYLWAVDMTSGTPQPAMYKMMYYCNEIVRVYDFNGISASIRCVKNAEPQPEPEPGTFNCGEGHPITIGSNSYETVQIGTQCWTKTNMRETKDKNGNDFIDGISAAAGSFDEYEDAVVYIPTEETWNVNNSSVTYDENTFGYYYNWTAANNVCPDGWHLPSDEEWTLLENYVSNAQDEEGNFLYRCDPSDATSIAKALASEADVWYSYAGECYPGGQSVMPNNATGFSAVPAGPWGDGFSYAGRDGFFWSSTEDRAGNAWYRSLYYHYADVGRYIGSRYYGFSVRCLRDAEE